MAKFNTSIVWIPPSFHFWSWFRFRDLLESLLTALRIIDIFENRLKRFVSNFKICSRRFYHSALWALYCIIRNFYWSALFQKIIDFSVMFFLYSRVETSNVGIVSNFKFLQKIEFRFGIHFLIFLIFENVTDQVLCSKIDPVLQKNSRKFVPVESPIRLRDHHDERAVAQSHVLGHFWRRPCENSRSDVATTQTVSRLSLSPQ